VEINREGTEAQPAGFVLNGGICHIFLIFEL
jgi:hypothetical protein